MSAQLNHTIAWCRDQAKFAMKFVRNGFGSVQPYLNEKEQCDAAVLDFV